jgi:hypothetical protein
MRTFILVLGAMCMAGGVTPKPEVVADQGQLHRVENDDRRLKSRHSAAGAKSKTAYIAISIASGTLVVGGVGFLVYWFCFREPTTAGSSSVGPPTTTVGPPPCVYTCPYIIDFCADVPNHFSESIDSLKKVTHGSCFWEAGPGSQCDKCDPRAICPEDYVYSDAISGVTHHDCVCPNKKPNNEGNVACMCKWDGAGDVCVLEAP